MEKRVGIYLRVSTQAQSTELQRAEIAAFLSARGWRAYTEYEDKQSGTDPTRPELRRLLRDARERKLDVVVCWKLDRLFRSLRDLVATLQEFNDLGVEFISLKDQIDMSTASGRLLVHLVSAFSEFEVSLIRERVRAGVENARRRGAQLGRPRTAPDSEIKRLRGSGLSLAQIAKRLNMSKTGVHKSLRRSVVQGSEMTGARNRVFVGNKSNDSSTAEIEKQASVACHETVNHCHEKDLTVIGDSRGSEG